MKNEGTEVTLFAIDLIDPSPYQSRRHFDEEKLKELAESIREHNIIQPLTARRVVHAPGRLELVAGERRLRAAKLAGLTEAKVIVYELTDREALEIVLIENLQREGLTVTEEAQGYKKVLDLRDEAGQPMYTLESLAKKIGITNTSYISDRLKLLVCPADLISAVEEKKVALSTAMLVGCVPDAKAREVVAKRVLKPEEQEVPLNYEQTKELIREEFMVSLQKPGFDIEDADLVKVVWDESTTPPTRLQGGSCLECPFCEKPQLVTGTQNSASLGEGGKIRQQGKMNLCTLPKCFRLKQDAAWKITRKLSEEQNVKVIEGDGAREIFQGWSGSLTYNSPWVQMDEKPGYEDVGEPYRDNKKTWATLLKGSSVEIVIARHPVSGKRVELANKKEARIVAKAKLKGVDVEVEQEAASTEAAQKKEDRSAEIRAGKIESLMINEGLSDLVAAIGRKGLGLEELEYVFGMVFEQGGSDGMASMAKWLEVPKPKNVSSGRSYESAVLEVVKARASTAYDWLGFIVAAVLCKHVKYSGSKGENFATMKGYFGIKDGELKRRAVAILDAGTRKKVSGEPLAVGGEEGEAAVRVRAWRDAGSPPGCPGCGDPLIFPRGHEFYCENCGWPDEIRTAGDDREIKGDICTRCGGMFESETEQEDHLNGPDCVGDKERSDDPGRQVANLSHSVETTVNATEERQPPATIVNSAELSFDEQVMLLVKGTHKVADLIGAAPKKNAPERKPWDKLRKRLTRAAEAVQAQMDEAA